MCFNPFSLTTTAQLIVSKSCKYFCFSGIFHHLFFGVYGKLQFTFRFLPAFPSSRVFFTVLQTARAYSAVKNAQKREWKVNAIFRKRNKKVSPTSPKRKNDGRKIAFLLGSACFSCSSRHHAGCWIGEWEGNAFYAQRHENSMRCEGKISLRFPSLKLYMFSMLLTSAMHHFKDIHVLKRSTAVKGKTRKVRIFIMEINKMHCEGWKISFDFFKLKFFFRQRRRKGVRTRGSWRIDTIRYCRCSISTRFQVETKEKSGEVEERVKSDAEKFLITRPTCILHLFISFSVVFCTGWNVETYIWIQWKEREFLVD